MTSPDKPQCPTCGGSGLVMVETVLPYGETTPDDCPDPYHQGDGGQAGPMPCFAHGGSPCGIGCTCTCHQTPKTSAAASAEVSSLSKTEDPSQLSKHRTNASSSPAISPSITPPTSFAAEVRRVFADRGFANDYALAPGGKTSTDYDIATVAIIEAVEKHVIGEDEPEQVMGVLKSGAQITHRNPRNDLKAEQRRHLHE